MNNNILKLLYIAIILSMVSCDSVYFNQPQPVDSKNIKKIPKKLRGMWVKDADTTMIGKTTYRNIVWNTEKMTKAEIDTNDSYLIRDNKIFDMDEDTTKGYQYIIQNDTIIVNIPEVLEYELGDFVILRSLTKNYFTLSVKEDTIRWTIYLIEKKENGTIFVRYPKKQELKILESLENNKEIEIFITPYEEDKITTSEFKKIWNVELSSKRFLEFVGKGGFSDTLFILEQQYKID